MIHQIWFMMMAFSMGYACLNGRAEEMLSAALGGTERAVSVSFQLCAGYLLFCGLMEIARALHVEKGIQRILRPLLKLVMPNVKKEETQYKLSEFLFENLTIKAKNNDFDCSAIEDCSMRNVAIEKREK